MDADPESFHSKVKYVLNESFSLKRFSVSCDETNANSFGKEILQQHYFHLQFVEHENK